MTMSRKPVLAMLLVVGTTATAFAAAATPPVAPAPSLSDVLASSGITATGYVDATYSYGDHSAALLPDTASADSFALNQAALTVSKLPAAGFGALVNVVYGTEAGTGLYAPSYSYAGNIGSSTNIDLLQAYLQYASGKATVLVGKFTTLAGAEVAAPTGNSNVTRSLLFWYSEPINHTGVRLAYAASELATYTFGVNNGWNVNTSTGRGKTVELGASLTPSKSLSLAASAYYGDTDVASGLGKRTLVDLVATWNATSALTVIGSVDYDRQELAGGAALKWWAAAGYLNYAINDAWRSSLRLEYLDDQDGAIDGASQKLKEGTLTFGYAPDKHFEFRIEARHDQSDQAGSQDITQGWLQALYRF